MMAKNQKWILIAAMAAVFFGTTSKALAWEVSPTGAAPWKEPNFTNQHKALGYSEDSFDVNDKIEKRVKFWIDIYTKYSESEGVIHVTDKPWEVLDVVSIAGIRTDKEKQKRIDLAKAAAVMKLAKAGRNISLDDVRFQQGLKERMKDALFISGRYMDKMEEIFEDAGLPKELTRIVYVESSFNIMARSKVGASGIWQIMPATAKPHKAINAAVDQRNNPLEATKMAAQLLKDNYRSLGKWPLAVTAYNHGASGIKKISVEYKSTDIGDLIEKADNRKSFAFASKNFYTTFLAALEVEKHATRYFPNIQRSKSLAAKEIKVPMTVSYKDLLKVFDGDGKKLQLFNPHLNKVVITKGKTIPSHTVLLVPKAKYSVALMVLSKKQMVALEEKPKSGKTR